MSVTTKLGVAWPVWKLVTKRLGPAGGLAAAAVAVVGYGYLRPWIVKKYPELAMLLE